MSTAVASFTVADSAIQILKNFAGIQNSVLLQPGKEQATVAEGKSLFALATLSAPWPQETGIYDLNTFLGTLSLFNKPAITFEKNVMSISSGGSKVKYRMSDPTTILTPPPNEPGNKLRNDNLGVEFTLSASALGQLNKSVSVLGLLSPTGEVAVTVADGVVTLRGLDEKNPSSHMYEYVVPDKDTVVVQPNFAKTISFKTKFIAMLLAGNYKISLSDRKYGFFQNTTEPVGYYIVGSGPTK